VKHRQFLHPEFLEAVMELLPLAIAVYTARGTPEYESLLVQLPEAYSDRYHVIIQYGE